LSPDGKLAYAATVGGTLLCFRTLDLELVWQSSAHAGIVAAVTHHASLPLLACLSADNTVSIWSTENAACPSFRSRVPLWGLQPTNDDRLIADFQSETQAIAFHHVMPRFATRAGNGSLLEVDLDRNGAYRYITCIRAFQADDITCVQYLPDNDILMAGSIDGDLALIFNGVVFQMVGTGGSNIHWIEHFDGGRFLLASDSRLVIRVDVFSKEHPLVGPRFARDDLEHVALTSDKRKAYAASFDRCIYEIDPNTCAPKAVVFEAPFKCRWVRPVPGVGDRILVQTRDGGLHLVDAATKKSVQSRRFTPTAIWTSALDEDGKLLLAGEGAELICLDPKKPSVERIGLRAQVKHGTYTKRMIFVDAFGMALLGRIDGQLVAVRKQRVENSINLGAPIRDMTCANGKDVYVALEDGRIVKIRMPDLQIVGDHKLSEEPIWSICANPSGKVAAAERGGALILVDCDTLHATGRYGKLARPKRMKWLDETTLLFVRSDELRKYDFKSCVEAPLLRSVGNTIEDFIFGTELQYLICISYMRNIYLARLETGEILCKTPDGLDYSKGLAWLSRTPSVMTDNPPEFVTYGRHGNVNCYRVANEKIHPLKSYEVSNSRDLPNA